MKLTHSYLCVRRHIESSFSNYMGPVKLMQASLGVRIDVEMIFHHCAWRSCEACSHNVECPKKSKEQFSPSWRTCKAVAGHFPRGESARRTK